MRANYRSMRGFTRSELMISLIVICIAVGGFMAWQHIAYTPPAQAQIDPAVLAKLPGFCRIKCRQHVADNPCDCATVDTGNGGKP